MAVKRKKTAVANFWQSLNRPIFALAPMDQVTSLSFREIFALYGKPDVMFTEFVNVDGLLHPEGQKKLKENLKFTAKQRPMVAQIWGNDPEKFTRAARLIAKLGFDGIDINMGCPQSKEVALGTCSALIKNPKLAVKIIKAVQKGAMSAGRRMPVSVKTRIGYSKVEELESWVKTLLKTNIAALTIHGRTKKEMSKVPAHWDAIARAVAIRNQLKSKTLILGNGDIKSREEAFERVKETGVDGVMIGRGAFGNPWIFNAKKSQPSLKERMKVLLHHARLFETMYKKKKPFAIMCKHFKAYASGFEGAHELRAQLMQAKNYRETRKLVNAFLKNSL